MNVITERQEEFNNYLSSCFGKLGSFIARNSWLFIILPILVAGGLASGIYFAALKDDSDIMSLPGEGKWTQEKRQLDRYFYKYDTSKNFDPIRLTNFGNYLNVIVVAEDGGSILRDDVWSAITDMDTSIRDFNCTIVDSKNSTTIFQYEDICARSNGGCVLPIWPLRQDIMIFLSKFALGPETPDAAIPLLDRALSHLNLSIDLMFGNPQFNRDGILISADAISLYFWLKNDTPEDRERSMQWEKQVAENLFRSRNFRTKVFTFTTRTMQDEIEIANNVMKPYLALSGFLMVVFAAATAAMGDWVRSKIVLSILGIISVLLATGGAFGVLIYCQVPFIGMNYVTIFLMLGIGIDDMFVFLAAWRMTSLEDTVERRLETTYRHSCMAITLTSLTNGVSFFIGSFTSLRKIQIFCIYSCVSCFFTYICVLTFFGGCLAVCGDIERRQRHSIFCCLRVQPKSMSGSLSYWHRTFLSGGINPLDAKNPEDNKDHLGMVLMRDYVGGLLNSKIGKVLIIFLYLIYVIALGIGLSKLELEATPYRVFFQDRTKNYFVAYDKYFSRTPSFVQIALTKELDYSSEVIREKILRLHHELEKLPFVRRKLTISWIRDYLQLKQAVPSLSVYELSFVQQLRQQLSRYKLENCARGEMTSVQIDSLKRNNLFSLSEREIRKVVSFLKDFLCNGKDYSRNFHIEREEVKDLFPYAKLLFWVLQQVESGVNHLETDVVFNDNFKRITSSRFIIVVDNGSEFHVQETLREVISQSGLPGVSIFNYQGIFADQKEFVRNTTLYSTITTAIIVLIISLIFIPNIICSLWIAFAIVSIEMGVVGFMVFWGVTLNAVSMVNLIMCVGFSVDFSAHITYAYLNANGNSNEERIRESMYTVGYPILLGGMSTIVGIIPLCFTKFVTFITFFKIIFLVIVLGLLHGLFFLPVFMTIIGPNKANDKEANETDSWQDNPVNEKSGISLADVNITRYDRSNSIEMDNYKQKVTYGTIK